MSLLDLFLIAVGLSMDAFAVAIAKGLGMARLKWGQALVIALFFGVFQGVMPVIGWLLGAQFAELIAPVDHWVAFVLLAFIGGKMLVDVYREKDDEASTDEAAEKDKPLDLRELLLLAIATSIDALAVGITFAFLDVSIGFSATFIGIVTFVLSLLGVAVGHQFGARWEKPSNIAGGVVLILIGLHILLNHLGVISF